jgi:hypothetical protein
MIIKLSMKSHSVLRLRTSPRTLLLAASLCALSGLPAFAGGKKLPPAGSASSYVVFDAHPAEHVTLAIDPCTEPKDCDFFRLPYLRHSLIPVRLIITNDSDAALSLDAARMQFLTANGDKLPAANLDDLNRRLFSTKQAMGSKVPLTNIRIHHAPIDKKITQDDQDFGFSTTTVAPHSTLAGYLFYDVKDLDDPPLKDAEIYVKTIRTASGKELFAFSLPFNKWLATQKPQPKP